MAEAKYSLTLVTDEGVGITKDIGENVFLSDLSDEYQVFAFYYPPPMPDEDLEAGLRSLGDLTGRNLLVNIGKLNDPSFAKIVKAFDIHDYPVVVVTATSDLAGAREDDVNFYVRIDDKRVLSDTARTVELVQEIYTLFLRGDIADAISKVKSKERAELIRAVARRIGSVLHHLAGFVADRDFKVSIVQGTFEMTKSAT
jgi:hypothetical protein